MKLGEKMTVAALLVVLWAKSGLPWWPLYVVCFLGMLFDVMDWWVEKK